MFFLAFDGTDRHGQTRTDTDPAARLGTAGRGEESAKQPPAPRHGGGARPLTQPAARRGA
eukprot:8690316-Prorocentrum_lima.AAC.1